MIKAVIFDLDGTLIKTERLKALSYGLAADELDPANKHENKALQLHAETTIDEKRIINVPTQLSHVFQQTVVGFGK